MYLFEKAFQIANRVTTDIQGRAADNGISLPYLACMAIAAGPGDHCEIGTLFGASAITVALAKKEWGLPGNVYCVDPYEPRDKEVSYGGPPGLRDGSPEMLSANADKFGVTDRLFLVQTKSHPWPLPLIDKKFVSAYIDGGHMGQTPWWDFIELAHRTEHYIAFDNYEESFPDVVNAGLRAINGLDWFVFFKNGPFLALRKTMNRPDRSMLDLNRT